MREQYKAKETDVRPEADEGGPGTGEARKVYVSRRGRTEMGGPGRAREVGVPCPCQGPREASWAPDMAEDRPSVIKAAQTCQVGPGTYPRQGTG